MTKNKILGYTNPTRSECGPLVTIVKKNNRIGAIFPDCTFFYLDISSTIDLMTFVPEADNRFIRPHQYSYLSTSGEILVMNENSIMSFIESDIKTIINTDTKEALIDLLRLEKQRVDELNPFEYILNINHTSDCIRIFFTDKKKSNGEDRKRLLIQHRKNGAYKTDYKKNLRISSITNREQDDTELKRISRSLRGTLKCLADRYKEEYSGMLLCV